MTTLRLVLSLAFVLFASTLVKADIIDCLQMTTFDLYGEPQDVFSAPPGEQFQVLVGFQNTCDYGIQPYAGGQGMSDLTTLETYTNNPNLGISNIIGTYGPQEDWCCAYFGNWNWNEDVSPGFSLDEVIFVSYGGNRLDDGSPINGTATANVTFVVSEPVEPVPEPGTLLLFGTGLVAIAAKFRKAKRKT